MHVHSTLIVCLRSTSVKNGPLKPGFLAAQSTASRRPQMDTSGLERTAACYVSTALLSGQSRLLPPPRLRTFPYCNCLRMLAENYGSVHRGHISYAKKIANLKALDTAYPQSLPCQKITRAEYWFRTSSREHSVSQQTPFRNWDPLHPQ